MSELPEITIRTNANPTAVQRKGPAKEAGKDPQKEAAKELARQRTQMLIELRKQHEEHVKPAQERLKTQLAARKTLHEALKAEPLTVPQLAQATGLGTHQVLWHMAAMKKYGTVEETGMDDDDEYYLYSLAKGAKS
jgi:predicted Rossmann fold nucleotide-binding protein DprA/Smf involved in DNA uptake